MKKLLVSTLFVFVCAMSSYAQKSSSASQNDLGLKVEKVDWQDAPVYNADEFYFHSPLVDVQLWNCKILEIKTASGTTGYLVVGQGKFTTKHHKEPQNLSQVMVRFNPDSEDEFVNMKNKKAVNDIGFREQAFMTLKTTFRRCYHSGMNAIIPPPKTYCTDLFTEKDGEVLISHDKKMGDVFYNFSERKQMKAY